jgi:hypothetical protein
MKPPGSGKVVRFRDSGDELAVTIPNNGTDPILPASTSTLTIDFEIYPRAYKTGGGGASIFHLRTVNLPQYGGADRTDSRWQVIATGGSPEVNGPNESFVSNTGDQNWNDWVPLNTWSHIQIHLDAQGFSHLLVNGNEVAHLDNAPNYSTSFDWVLSLGNFDGDIDELRISH